MTRTLLFVDDEPDILETMRVLLKEDYSVLTAQGGAEALEILERESVDMVISDQRMPKMTGVELLTRVWELYPDIVRVILTAYTDTDVVVKAINEGRVYRYIVKPWNVDDMRLVIRQGLEWKDLTKTKGQLNADLVEAHRALAERTKELEQAQEIIVRQEKIAAVGRFAAEMVHEMNNHLQIVMGLGAYLQATLGGEISQLQDLTNHTTTLAAIAGYIRDFAKGAMLPLKLEKADPLGTAEDVVRVCKHHPAFRDITVQLAAGKIRPWVMDAKQVKHLLINLLKNAAKATPSGGRIEVHVGVQNDELMYMIKDHGVGIPEDQWECIWEPFFTTWEQNGTGLGLNICQRIVEMHRGSIVCKPTQRGGTTFIVLIPKEI